MRFIRSMLQPTLFKANNFQREIATQQGLFDKDLGKKSLPKRTRVQEVNIRSLGTISPWCKPLDCSSGAVQRDSMETMVGLGYPFR